MRFEVSSVTQVRLKTVGYREGVVEGPNAWLKNLKQAVAVVERFQSEMSRGQILILKNHLGFRVEN